MNERGHFLNEQQKEIKQKIMEDLMSGLFGNMENKQELFTDQQSILDLVFSILVMFNRDVLSHVFLSLELSHKRKDILKNLFNTITEQVNRIIKDNQQ